MGMYALLYISIIFLHQLLGGHSVYFQFTYCSLGIVISIAACILSVLTRSQLRPAGLIISIVMLFGFCNELGIIPIPDIFEVVLFIVVYIAGAFLLLTRRRQHEPVT